MPRDGEACEIKSMNRGINFCSRWNRVVSFTLRPTYLGKLIPGTPSGRDTAGPQCSLNDAENRRILWLLREIWRPLVVKPVAWSLQWLSYTVSCLRRHATFSVTSTVRVTSGDHQTYHLHKYSSDMTVFLCTLWILCVSRDDHHK
jgi:hypothetical protein